MRLLQVIAGAKYGGAEAFFVRLAGALDRAGVNQQVIIRANSSRAEELHRLGIDPLQLKFGGKFDWRTPWHIRKEVDTFRPDILLSWMNRATAMCPAGDFVHVSRLGGYYDLKYYQACDHLIGNTEDIVSYLVEQGWPEEKAHYLPNFVTSKPEEPLMRKELYTPDLAPLFLCMGRLHENKGFDVMLEALSRVPNAYLWIAGEGAQRQYLENMAEVLGVKPRVRFLGWRNDVEALLACCDVFVCPSRHEPLGNVVLEAWAHNCPVVAADSPGPGNLIEHLETGVLVPVDNAAKLSEALRMVIDDTDLCEDMVRCGYEAYLEHFTEAVVVAKYLEFFDGILS